MKNELTKRQIRKRALRKKIVSTLMLFSLIPSLALFAMVVNANLGDESVSNKRESRSFSWQLTEKQENKYRMERLQISPEDVWKTLLVNGENPVPKEHEMILHYVEGDFLVDSRIVAPLQNMLNTMRDEGLSPLIVSAFRCYASQTTIFENRVNALMNNGLTREQAISETSRVIAVPGTSEHQIGLAVDIVSLNYQNLTESFDQTAESRWLVNNSANFGFILRYPKGTEHLTGIIYEPWHFRYVGVEVARYLTENNLTLEEFHSNPFFTVFQSQPHHVYIRDK